MSLTKKESSDIKYCIQTDHYPRPLGRGKRQKYFNGL